MMEQLAQWFDWIIIDSPPVLPLADTSVWMRLADGVLLVTRQGTTEKQQLQKGLLALDSTKLLGALVNGSMASAYSGYYYRSSLCLLTICYSNSLAMQLNANIDDRNERSIS